MYIISLQMGEINAEGRYTKYSNIDISNNII